ncbi:6-phosphogluconolactonase [Pedobacter cryophilus]|uniref:Glucosamine-6-phosphate deaminase n=1 Tax=Pedobacter cryophilus TaxID=2571271 RepID=A0A4V5NXG4_9SPHI|nr:6-phosphogluconolactonase [Pedobacter cryophilus]TKB99203.1 glucosamine-6-phosphate deaminase [Pedobacter cryophilus]
MIQEFKVQELTVKVYKDRKEMGEAAAEIAAAIIRRLLAHKEEINIVFAAAPSQNEFLDSLKTKQGIGWDKINAFHMDEYINLDIAAPQGFGNFLKQRIFDSLPFLSVNYLNGNAKDADLECNRYSSLLEKHPADIVFMGIGENGHLAFNDPPVADFNDQQKVKIVELDEICRQQQVNDGCFISLSEVPTHALTLTIPVLVGATYICCMVPGFSKANAVKDTITQEIKEQFPATILRRQNEAILFLDAHSSSLLDNQTI